MMTAMRFSLKGLALGLVLGVASLAMPQAQAQNLGSALHLRDASALPMVDVQARRPVRRQPTRRGRGNNGAVVAGALIGAAVLGGAIIANSQAQRRQRRYEEQYYHGAPQPYYGGGVRYQQPQYYGQPNYYRPQRRYAPQPRVYEQPRQRYRAEPDLRRAPRNYSPDFRYNPQTGRGEWDKTWRAPRSQNRNNNFDRGSAN
ncbi:hypothetical protein MCEMSEM23_02455 [Rhabdaerophilaceae bacterium]